MESHIFKEKKHVCEEQMKERGGKGPGLSSGADKMSRTMQPLSGDQGGGCISHIDQEWVHGGKGTERKGGQQQVNSCSLR